MAAKRSAEHRVGEEEPKEFKQHGTKAACNTGPSTHNSFSCKAPCPHHSMWLRVWPAPATLRCLRTPNSAHHAQPAPGQPLQYPSLCLPFVLFNFVHGPWRLTDFTVTPMNRCVCKGTILWVMSWPALAWKANPNCWHDT